MPTISCPDRPPTRAVLRVPQTAEQLVDVPQQPQSLLFTGPDGSEWCRVTLPGLGSIGGGLVHLTLSGTRHETEEVPQIQFSC